MEQGNDPKAVSAKRKIQAVTLFEVFESYKAKRELRPRTLQEYTNNLHRCVPDWLNLPISGLTRSIVEERLIKLSSANGPRGEGKAQAGQCYRPLRSLMRFAQEEYEVESKPILEADPTRNLSRGRPWTEKIRRQGVVQKHQLASWFKAVLALSDETVREYLIVVMLTGLRRSEALSLKWADIDLQGAYLRIDASTSKNHLEHRLPLSDNLHDLLKERLQRNQLKSPYVFPGKVPGSHLQEPKRMLKRVAKSSGIQFMLHDLRRTFLTVAESLDISGHTLKKLANHSTRGDVTSGYIVSDMERLREPMQRITDYILDHAGLSKNEPDETAL